MYEFLTLSSLSMYKDILIQVLLDIYKYIHIYTYSELYMKFTSRHMITVHNHILVI